MSHLSRSIPGFLLALFWGLAGPAAAFEGRYAIQGVGPEGSYEGSSLVIRPRDGRRPWRVYLKTQHAGGNERRARAAASAGRGKLRFTCRAVRNGYLPERPIRVLLQRVDDDPDSLIATYSDPDSGEVVRREAWLRDERVRIPVVLVALTGSEGFVGVDPERAAEAQTWVLAQLNGVYSALDVHFVPFHPAPTLLPGAPYDADGDGQLSRRESEALRDALAEKGLKRPGRAVLVLTAAEFVGEGCRGWTLGDAPASPDTLEDPNDNFSLVGLSYIDPSRFHTVAHEVGHQLGLDDLNPRNRRHLSEPAREDHLMQSGGKGLFLDSRVETLLRRTLGRFPDHGLEGKRHAPPKGPDAEPGGLPTPGG